MIGIEQKHHYNIMGGNCTLLLPIILGCYDLDGIVVYVKPCSLISLKQGTNLRFNMKYLDVSN